MNKIDMFEAQSRLGQLLDIVERGEEVVVTHHRRVVAKIVPISAGHDRDHARRIADQLLDASRGLTLGGIKIKHLISEGSQ